MKFWAILKDSVREAVDFKVLYVMVGLSVLLGLVAASLSFTPAAKGGREVIHDYAILPLNSDAASLTPASLDQLSPRPVRFTVDSVEPLDEEPDAPASKFRVKLTATFATNTAARKAEAAPQELLDFVRDRFGHFPAGTMMEATELRLTSWEGLNLPLLDRNFGGRRAHLKLVAVPTPTTIRFWPHQATLFFGAVPPFPFSLPLFVWLQALEGGLIGQFGSVIAVLVSIIITAFFIPNMLRKGTVDLLLVKPIHRPVLLAYKFVGGLTFMFVNTLVAVSAVWLALALRSGVWAPTFLLAILELTFAFAVLYSVSALFGVLTRSPIACILLTITVWFVFFIIAQAHTFFELRRGMDRVAQTLHDQLGDEGMESLQKVANLTQDSGQSRRGGRFNFEEMRWQDNWFTNGVSMLHKVLPRSGELYALMDERLQQDLAFGTFHAPPHEDRPPPTLPGGIQIPSLLPAPPSLAEVLGVSTAFMAVMLGLACWRFSRRDY